jgi:hypothetical protein
VEVEKIQITHWEVLVHLGTSTLASVKVAWVKHNRHQNYRHVNISCNRYIVKSKKKARNKLKVSDHIHRNYAKPWIIYPFNFRFHQPWIIFARINHLQPDTLVCEQIQHVSSTMGKIKLLSTTNVITDIS